MSTILVVSQDAMLLETRALVLRHTGAQVVGATAAQALAVFDAQPEVDLVVLCHSIPEPLRRDLVDALLQRNPAPELLIVSRERFPGVRETPAMGLVGSSDPSALIHAASRLLAHRV